MKEKFLSVAGRMPVGAWVSPPPASPARESFITPESYRTAAACGLNFLHTCYEEDDSKNNAAALAAAAEAGMKLIVNDPAFFAGNAEERLAGYRSYPSFWGVGLKDEPGISDFDTLARCVLQYGKKLREGEILYSNLMPMYASPQQLNGGWFEGRAGVECCYEKYLSGFTERVKIPLLSYDFYPFRGEKGHTDADYFTQLALGLRYAERSGVPLWVFIQVTSWMEGEIRTMTYSEIDWQVSTSLAFGAKGIQYFTYWTPADRGGERFGLGMIAPDGTATERYYFVRHINRQVAAVGGKLLAAKRLGVITNSAVPIPGQCLCRDTGIAVSGANYLSGCFTLGGKRLYYLVNLSLFEFRAYRVEAAFAPLVTRGGKSERQREMFSLLLAPGEGALIEEE